MAMKCWWNTPVAAVVCSRSLVDRIWTCILNESKPWKRRKNPKWNEWPNVSTSEVEPWSLPIRICPWIEWAFLFPLPRVLPFQKSSHYSRSNASSFSPQTIGSRIFIRYAVTTSNEISMMSHRVKVLPRSTLRLNWTATMPYNGNFNGDEMNLHWLQSVETEAGFSQPMMVFRLIVTPQSNRLRLIIVQDTLTVVRKMIPRGMAIFLNQRS